MSPVDAGERLSADTCSAAQCARYGCVAASCLNPPDQQEEREEAEDEEVREEEEVEEEEEVSALCAN